MRRYDYLEAVYDVIALYMMLTAEGMDSVDALPWVRYAKEHHWHLQTAERIATDGDRARALRGS